MKTSFVVSCAFILILGASFGFISMAGATVVDSTPPVVLSWTPADNSTSVSVNVQPVITFSEPLSPATVKSGNIELRSYVSSTEVSVVYILSDNNTVVTFNITSTLSYSKQYYFFIGTGVKDVAGNSFAGNTWYATQKANHEFTTESPDITPPIITILPYFTSSTNADITVSAATNEGVLNTSTHIFTENDSFDFVATDAAGNVSTSTVTISNIDKVAPVISLLGDSAINLFVGDAYIDASATSTDNVDGDITVNIITLNSVNTTVAGTYTVTYNVSDSAGNAAASINRTVVVADRPVVVPPSSGSGGGGYFIPINVNPILKITPIITPPVLIPFISAPDVISKINKPAAPKLIGQVLGLQIINVDDLIATLKPKKHNPKVKDLQKELKKLGFYPKLWVITDYYGPVTTASVKKYLVAK